MATLLSVLESFFDTRNSVHSLARDLKIEHKIIQNNNGRTFIAIGNKLHQIPSNLLLGGSPKILSMLTSNFLSLSGKIRAAGDLLLPKLPHEADEPISDFSAVALVRNWSKTLLNLY